LVIASSFYALQQCKRVLDVSDISVCPPVCQTRKFW